jgi:hypothetical protein
MVSCRTCQACSAPGVRWPPGHTAATGRQAGAALLGLDHVHASPAAAGRLRAGYGMPRP